MGRQGLSTFSWVFCQGATTPLHLHDVTVFVAVKFGVVPPSPPLRHPLHLHDVTFSPAVKFGVVPPLSPLRQQGVDGPLHVRDVTVTSRMKQPFWFLKF